MVTSPWRERREVWKEKRKVRVFGKGKCKLIANCANFWQRESVNSSPILARQWWRHFRLSLSVSLSLSLSLSLSHRKYLTHNIGIASALPIIKSPSPTVWFEESVVGDILNMTKELEATCTLSIFTDQDERTDMRIIRKTAVQTQIRVVRTRASGSLAGSLLTFALGETAPRRRDRATVTCLSLFRFAPVSSTS